MSQDDVERILGPPDVIQHIRIPESVGTSDFNWFYGVSGDSPLATLGIVTFDDESKRVRGVQGDQGGEDRIVEQIPDEEEIRRNLRIIHRAAKYKGDYYAPVSPKYGEKFNPLAFAEVCNDLHALGKDDILASFTEYGRVVEWEGNICVRVLLLLLFPDQGDGDESGPPVTDIGLLVLYPEVEKGMDVRRVSPVVVVDDIPLLVFRGYHGAGAIMPLRSYVKRFSSRKLREAPLAPKEVKDIDAIIERLRESHPRLFGADSGSAANRRQFVRDQLESIQHRGRESVD